MRRSIRFLLGHEERELHDVDPTMTVLQYLRSEERKTGTKEGCAEGDCGACTVVIGEPDGERMRYRAVNACILFLPVLDGCQLITVEHLKREDGELHPVQRAMYELHASQCGFCTPGFVMSMLALYLNETSPSRDTICDALAGNLCRCTGYRPIIDAAQAMYDYDWQDPLRAREAETAARLTALRSEETLALVRGDRRYFAPQSVEALAELLAEYPRATLLAGGTDVGLWVTKLHQDLDTVVYLGAISELHTIVEGEAALEIGAGATYTEAFDALARHYPDFGELLRRLASTQIRNSGTIGGNIGNGSPIGDSMPVLIALGAELVLRSREGERRMPIEDYFIEYRKTALRPGEFIERIRVPYLAPEDQFRCYKISKRFDQDISAVCAAFKVRVEQGRVVDASIGFGGVAATPVRARATEAALKGQAWDEASIAKGEEALAAEFTPLTDMRASADYRRLVSTRLLRKFFVETVDLAEPTRVLAEEVV